MSWESEKLDIKNGSHFPGSLEPFSHQSSEQLHTLGLGKPGPSRKPHATALFLHSASTYWMPAMRWASGQSSEQGLALKEHKDADGPFQWAEKAPGTREPDGLAGSGEVRWGKFSWSVN